MVISLFIRGAGLLTLSAALLIPIWADAQDPKQDPKEVQEPIRLKKKAPSGEKPAVPKKVDQVTPKPAPDKSKEAKSKESSKEENPAEIAAVEEKIKETIERLSRNLREAENRLKKSDPGEQTQLVQKDIVKDLGDLIDQSIKQQEQQQQQKQQQQSGQKGKSSKQKKNKGKGQQKQEQGNPQPQMAQQQQNPTGNPPPGGQPKNGEISKIADIYKDIWGHLPETLRQEMNQYSREQFMAKYSELLKQYYATIAEKGRRQPDK